MAKTKHFGALAAAAGALVAVALLVLVLVVVNPQPAKAAFPSQNGRIAFASNRDGDYDIWIVHSSFQRPTFTRITNNPATDYAADWQSLP
jgi:hypothetical protein